MILHLYKRLLNISLFTWFLEPIGDRIRKYLFKHQDTRVQPYTIDVYGRTYTLFLDWMDTVDFYYIIYRVFEKENSNYMLHTLKPGDVFVDVGASVGYFTFLAPPEVRVFAVEPLRRNLHALTLAKEANSAHNVTIEACAVGNEETEATLRYRYLSSGSPSLANEFGVGKKVIEAYMLEEKVVLHTMTTLFTKWGITKCTLMKLDIQGGELAALKGMEELLKSQSVENFVIEYNEASSGRTCYALLVAYGYRCHRLTKKGEAIPIDGPEQMLHKQLYLYSASPK